MPQSMYQRASMRGKEPFYIPGYAGNLPQLRYQCGKTYSPTTHQLLTDPTVAKSSHTVLGYTDANVRNDEDVFQERRKLIMADRTLGLGDKKFTSSMVPGYTGEIPKMMSYSGKTFAVEAFNAISDFENEQRKHRNKFEDLKLLNARQYGQNLSMESALRLPPLTTDKTMPLQRVRPDMKEYQPPTSHKYKQNVYKLPNHDRDKRYMAGYMGFVPQTFEKFGKDFEQVTHSGLNDFTDELKKRDVVLSTPVKVERELAKKPEGVVVYHQTAGLVPRYTGHAPGGRYRFGKTYWETSYNAKEKFTPRAQAWSLQQRAISSP